MIEIIQASLREQSLSSCLNVMILIEKLQECVFILIMTENVAATIIFQQMEDKFDLDILRFLMFYQKTPSR